jgi:hypothetical protein
LELFFATQTFQECATDLLIKDQRNLKMLKMVVQNAISVILLFLGIINSRNIQVSAWMKPIITKKLMKPLHYTLTDDPRPPRDMLMQVIERKHNEVTALEEKYKDTDTDVGLRLRCLVYL